MISGRLKYRIAIEHAKQTHENILGEEERREVEMVNTRADVQWGDGGRRDMNREIVPYYKVTFVTWDYLWGKVTEGDKVTYDGKEYLLDSIERVPDQKLMYLHCVTA